MRIHSTTGWTEANFLWGARLNRKKFLPEFEKFLLYKSKKDGGPVPPQPPQFRPPCSTITLLNHHFKKFRN